MMQDSRVMNSTTKSPSPSKAKKISQYATHLTFLSADRSYPGEGAQ
jgi:hypothetical protein